MILQDQIILGLYITSVIYLLYILIRDMYILSKKPECSDIGHRRTHIYMNVEFIVIQLMFGSFIYNYSIYLITNDYALSIIYIILTHFNYNIGSHLKWELE